MNHKIKCRQNVFLCDKNFDHVVLIPFVQVLSLTRSGNEQMLILPGLSEVGYEKANGLGLELPNGSLYFIDGKSMEHGVNKQASPNSSEPKRISEVFFRANIGQHPNHAIHFMKEQKEKKRSEQQNEVRVSE